MLNGDKHRLIADVFSDLMECAQQGHKITYLDLGRKRGIPAVSVGHYLDPIAVYCKMSNLPPITVLVAQTGSGEPGTGYLGRMDNIDEHREQVYGHDWSDLPPDVIAELMAG